MGFIGTLIDLALHLDVHLDSAIQQYGTATYAILFLIVFCETGLVVTPFLPGDSLLFAAGAFAARGSFEPLVLFGIFALASILGDGVNYHIGRAIGPRVFRMKTPWIKQDYLAHTRQFYARHGNKAIILSRFLPILRTFAPFVAGVGTMDYRQFVVYNIAGGLIWTAVFVGGGYFFGNIPWVQEHFSFVVLGIIALSALIALRELWKHHRH